MHNHVQNSFGGFKVKSRYLSIIRTFFTCEYNIVINKAHIVKIAERLNVGLNIQLSIKKCLNGLLEEMHPCGAP